LVTNPDAPRFPDIERAWNQAMVELRNVGIDVREKPLFLILGRSAGPLDGLMEASGLAMRLRRVPDESDAPICLYAGDSGIFVICPGLTLAGKSAEAWLDRLNSVGFEAATPVAVSSAESGQSAGEGGAPATTVTASRVRRRVARSSLLESAREVERTTAGLRLLCRLVARDRRPYCPVNGVLVALPFDLARSDPDTDLIAAACRQDLDTVEAVLQVGCPVLAVFTDLDREQGFGSLINGFTQEQLAESLGIDLPPIFDQPDERVAGMVEEAVRWLAFDRLPSMVHPRWQFAPEPIPDPANVGLYELLRNVQEGQRALSRVLVQGFYRGPRRHLKLAGAYFAATGPREAERAFGPAAFRRAIGLQDHVSWTPAVIARDRVLKGRSSWGYVAIVVWLFALIAASLWLFERLGSRSS
jgi:hypothetical protein